ncbi:MAG: AAA family ATPase [Verrucomicrobiota bacterium]
MFAAHVPEPFSTIYKMNSTINGDGANCAPSPQIPIGPSPSVTSGPVNTGIRATQAPVRLTSTVISDRPTCVPASRLLLDETIRPPEELIPGLLHMGTKSMLVGASKCGKTWLLMDLAISVATGTPFLRWECNAGKVLYVNFEIAKPFFRTRLETILRSRGLTTVENLHTLHLRGTSIDFAELTQEITNNSRAERYALIILDPIYKATGSRSDGASAAVAKICAQLDIITNQTGAAVVFAHHSNKGNARAQQVIDRMSGSGTWARDLDSIISVSDLALHPGHYVVETKLRNYETFPPFVIRREGANIELRDDVDPPVPEDSADVSDRGLLQLLGTERLTTADFCSRAVAHSIPRSTFYRVLRLLQRTGRIYYDALFRTWTRTRRPRLNENAPAQPTYEPENRILWLNETRGTNETQAAGETNETTETETNGGTGEADENPESERTPPPI